MPDLMDKAYVEKVANLMLTGIRTLDGREFIPPDLPLAGWEEGDLFITMSHELANDIGNQLAVIAKRMGGNGNAETSTQ